MIKANELRIGNLLHDKDKNIIDVSGLLINELYINNNYNPILLTKKWLVKFGLEKQEQYIKYGNGADWQPEYPKSIYDTYLIEFEEDYYFGFCYEYMKYKENNKIKTDYSKKIIFGDFYYNQVDSSDFIYCKIPRYLHELQNLFFILTGMELNYT
jgi:hypothetical protein